MRCWCHYGHTSAKRKQSGFSSVAILMQGIEWSGVFSLTVDTAAEPGGRLHSFHLSLGGLTLWFTWGSRTGLLSPVHILICGDDGYMTEASSTQHYLGQSTNNSTFMFACTHLNLTAIHLKGNVAADSQWCWNPPGIFCLFDNVTLS